MASGGLYYFIFINNLQSLIIFVHWMQLLEQYLHNNKQSSVSGTYS